jgi:hypothetical protein
MDFGPSFLWDAVHGVARVGMGNPESTTIH